MSIGIRGALVEGCTFGVANSLIYLAEALLFYVGAVLIAKGMYMPMVEVCGAIEGIGEYGVRNTNSSDIVYFAVHYNLVIQW
jgi:hypothetical protein